VTFVSLQKQLLASALDIADEHVIYSTCSLEPEENDGVVDAVLRTKSEFTRADIARFVPEGARRWVEQGVLRLTPDSGADGFTAFVLSRSR
jgi:16S rRNA C967 or C1407 C5-methylase (RsmB/RsmF family)